MGAELGKLFKLKQWLTVDDAASHLSIVFGEDVSAADVFRLALDGGLKLSVQLVNGAYGRPCVPVEIGEIEWKEIPSLDGKGVVKIAKGGRVWQDEGRLFQVKSDVSSLPDGIWDLPMTGGERIDVEYAYQQLTGGPEVTAVSLDGVFVESSSGDLFEVQSHYADNEYFNKENLKKPLLQRENFHPAGGLPYDAVFVVRVDALLELEKTANPGPDSADKPLTNRERDTLLTIIGVLCKDAGYDHTRHAKTAGLIQSTAAQMGVSIGETTIEGHLKKIPDALGTRMK